MPSHIMPLLTCHAQDDPEVHTFFDTVCGSESIVGAILWVWARKPGESYPVSILVTEQVLYESMVVMYLMTQLPPLPKIELDDDKIVLEKKRRIFGAALVPSFEGLVLIKEQLASSKNVLTVFRLSVCDPV